MLDVHGIDQNVFAPISLHAPQINATNHLARSRRAGEVNQGEFGFIPAVADDGPLDLGRAAAAATGGGRVLVRIVVVEGLHDHGGDLQQAVQAAVFACGGKNVDGWYCVHEKS